uniref:uncharacterized protein LOC120327305 n=1 Tax=Styela clava TaxID=7725 RepID=UPI0019396985|nr:uncharacterized protein LOC120327305 [Styela clava]XP_039249698.1 uncharacterized protein LOC120327305 [Styela clava]XP_039249699.1 uncharacterized protein LOC120327305 [Styela clava]XP_039249700.1 uncharacterized protein LOC120327305 [Styela clava]XP_039249701.1 uncharacterized protein LOC120327305 [Styela clava]
MDTYTDHIFESLFELDYLKGSGSEIELSTVSNDFMSANTPPYEESENEDDQLLNKLLSESAMPEDDSCMNSYSTMPSESRSPSFSGSCSPSSTYGTEQDCLSLEDVAQSSMVKNSRVCETVRSKKTVRGKSVSQNRGAINARENREKRKLYIKGLENSVQQLTTENESMRSQIDLLQRTVDALSQDATYLRNVMENQSELSKILKAVSTVPGIFVKPSLKSVNLTKTVDKTSGKRKLPTCSDEPCDKKKNTNTGICLHVKNGSVSFELCSQCNSSSPS